VSVRGQLQHSSDFDARGRPAFNEAKARELIGRITHDHAYRIVGTKALRDSELYLLDVLHGIKAELEVSDLKGTHQLEIWHQKDDGSHLFNIAGKRIWKKYCEYSSPMACCF
jgi:hypothetical protein